MQPMHMRFTTKHNRALRVMLFVFQTFTTVNENAVRAWEVYMCVRDKKLHSSLLFAVAKTQI